MSNKLRRSVGLAQLILYGLGTTIGAGIYALIGEIAAMSGYMAPWSFLTAAGLAFLTALSFATLSHRYPQAAGIALYIEKGFSSTRFATACGMLAAFAGITSSAALLNGFVGYAQEFIALDRVTMILCVMAFIGGLACIGISQSVTVAACITIVEIGGLIWVTLLAAGVEHKFSTDLTVFIPTLGLESSSIILSGAILAFYAYIGFEDMIEVAEEVKSVRTNLPRAIMITLAISTILYLSLVSTALLATGPDYLGHSNAPLADLVRAVSNQNPSIISAIGMFAIINGVLIQVIMASRILYGLASRQQLPSFLARVNPHTHTPLFSTALTSITVTCMAVVGNISGLAELTSLIILGLFAGVNFSLWRLQRANGDTALSSRITQLTALVGGILCAGLITIQVTT